MPNDVILGVDAVDIISEVDLGALLSPCLTEKNIELSVLEIAKLEVGSCWARRHTAG